MEPLLFFQIAPQLPSRGWVDPVRDPLLLRKSGSAGNRTRDLWICSQELWTLGHRGGRSKLSAGVMWSHRNKKECIWKLCAEAAKKDGRRKRSIRNLNVLVWEALIQLSGSNFAFIPTQRLSGVVGSSWMYLACHYPSTWTASFSQSLQTLMCVSDIRKWSTRRLGPSNQVSSCILPEYKQVIPMNERGYLSYSDSLRWRQRNNYILSVLTKKC
jgi:hypothetical protein